MTITDATGCTDVRAVKFFSSFDPNQDYLLQNTTTGEFLAPAVAGADWREQQPMIFGDCPRAQYAWRFADYPNGPGNYVTNVLSNWPWIIQNDGQITEFFRRASSDQEFDVNFVSGDVITLYNPATDSCVVAGGTGSVLALGSCADALQLRLVPLPDCPTAGDGCDDGNNSTDDDVINLLCSCCGDANACFGVAGAGPNDDGDADGDGFCVDEDCACAGLPSNCAETGDQLDNVSARIAVTTVRHQLPTSPGAEVLTDGVIAGEYQNGNGNVWHSNGGFAYVDLDLRTLQNVKEIRIYPRTDCCTDRLNNVDVMVADEPFPTAVPSRTNNQAVADYFFTITNYDSPEPFVLRPATLGRYVRLKNESGGPMNLTEVEVYTCPRSGMALPLDFLALTGRSLPKHNELAWTTARERDLAGFYVERLTTDGTFRTLAHQPATGDGQYHHTDESPLPASSTYRIRAEDLDGTIQYSDQLTILRSGPAWRVYPNPTATGGQLWFEQPSPETSTLQLYDGLGRCVRAVSVAEARQSIDLAGIAPGVYLLRINGATEGHQRIVIH